MDSILLKVRSFVERHSMLEGARGVVAGVSGGPDSVVLLDLLTRLTSRIEQSPPFIHIAHLDHQLRGARSAEDAQFVADLASRLGLPVTISSADIAGAARRTRRGIEETAREIRHTFLLRAAIEAGADRIATGHTMNDQAETLLMRLARGAGTAGLSSIRPVAPALLFDRARDDVRTRPLLIRPLLCLTREEVEQYCADRGLSYRTDETNLITCYTRNRIRSRVIPVLRELNPRAVEAIARAAEIAAADEAVLKKLAESAIGKARRAALLSDVAYSATVLAELPEALRRRAVIDMIQTAAGRQVQVSASRLEEINRLLAEGMSGKRVELPGGLAVWREFDELVVRPVSSDSFEAELDAEHSQVEIGGFTLILTRKVPGSSLRSLLEDARQKREAGRDWMMAVLDDSRLPERLGVRGRLPGERAAVSGHRSAKKLKNLMIDHRIPSSRRASWPVVATREGQYVWSPGLPPANKFAAGVESPRLAVIEASES